MIAKGNLHAHGLKLAAYLTSDFQDERAERIELRGFVANNIRDAFIDVQLQAAGTNATKPLFHAYVRLPEAEGAAARLHWQCIVDRLEQRLGFQDQPRAVAFHHAADGESHIHIGWSRIDLVTMKAIDPGLYKNKLKQASRELETELGLTAVRNERLADDLTQAPPQNEFEQSRRLHTDLKAIRNQIRTCWDRADTGKAFIAALEEMGLILTKGDKRDFVIVDHAGGDHALGKRITGATAAETRARMADIDRASLPTVAAAKERQNLRRQSEMGSDPAVADRVIGVVSLGHDEARQQGQNSGGPDQRISALLLALQGLGRAESSGCSRQPISAHVGSLPNPQQPAYPLPGGTIVTQSRDSPDRRVLSCARKGRPKRIQDDRGHFRER